MKKRLERVKILCTRLSMIAELAKETRYEKLALKNLKEITAELDSLFNPTEEELVELLNKK